VAAFLLSGMQQFVTLAIIYQALSCISRVPQCSVLALLLFTPNMSLVADLH
jgi:hypothetical protein